jgi:methionine-rich copper-binding protein CopC
VLTRRLSTTFLVLLAAVLTTAALAVSWAAPAQAHSELISSSPSDGDSTSEIPTEIVLEFNEDIQDIGNEIVVVDQEGTSVTDGEMVVDGATVRQPIGVGAAGVYTVTWRVVSADGHPISGELSYELRVPQTVETTEEMTDPTTEASSEATLEASSEVAPSSAEAEEDESSGLGAAGPIIIGLVVLALVAIVILAVRRRRAR